MRTRMRAAALFSPLALGIVVVGPAPMAVAAEVGPLHVITCSWDKNVGTPWAPNSVTVKGFVRVRCTDKLDEANTQAHIQIYDRSWNDRGDPIVSHNKGPVIQVNDDTLKRPGTWKYRTKGTHFGQHGNIWSLPTYYSPVRTLTRVH
ncbi:hypothetical protein [Streptomyces mirabilis]|uniref:hypothetical protein n=1 Tax=Streptomyces mirabilis TaxID=68239 RepID=UPI0033B95BAB